MALFVDFHAMQMWDMSSVSSGSSVSCQQMVCTRTVLSSKGPPMEEGSPQISRGDLICDLMG